MTKRTELAALIGRHGIAQPWELTDAILAWLASDEMVEALARAHYAKTQTDHWVKMGTEIHSLDDSVEWLWKQRKDTYVPAMRAAIAALSKEK